MTQPAETEAEPAAPAVAAEAELEPDEPTTVAEQVAAHQQRVSRNVKAKANGTKRLGFVNRSFADKWAEEILPLIRQKKIASKDVRIDVSRVDPPGPKGGPLPVGYFFGNLVDGSNGDGRGAAAQCTDYVIDNIHVHQGVGAAVYELMARETHGGAFTGDGPMQLDEPEKIAAIRESARRASAQSSRGFQGFMPPPMGAAPPPWQAPPPPQAFGQPPPGFGQPPPPPMPQGPAGDVTYERAQQERIAGLREQVARAQAELDAYARAPAPPQAGLSAEQVADIVDKVLERRGLGGQPPAPQGPPPTPETTPMGGARSVLGFLGDYLKFDKEMKEGLRTLIRAVDPPPPPPLEPAPEEHAAEVVQPGEGEAPEEGMPFTVEDMPGVQWRGRPVKWVQVKPGRKVSTLEGVLAWAQANADNSEDILKKAIEFGDRVVQATTVNARGEPSQVQQGVAGAPASQPSIDDDPWPDMRGGR